MEQPKIEIVLTTAGGPSLFQEEFEQWWRSILEGNPPEENLPEGWALVKNGEFLPPPIENPNALNGTLFDPNPTRCALVGGQVPYWETRPAGYYGVMTPGFYGIENYWGNVDMDTLLKIAEEGGGNCGETAQHKAGRTENSAPAGHEG